MLLNDIDPLKNGETKGSSPYLYETIKIAQQHSIKVAQQHTIKIARL